MKKTVALIMALALVLCSFSALAAREKDAYTWAKALPDGAKFMFDYSCMQPVQAVKIKNGYGFYDLVTTSGDKKVVVDSKNRDNAMVKVPVRVGENGKMFGTVSGKEVAAAIEEQLGLTVDKKKISLDTVRSTGEYVAKLSLFEEVKANLKVIVEEQK